MTDTFTPVRVRVDLGERGYDICIGPGLAASIADHLQPVLARDRVFVVSDETVWGLHGAALQAALDTGNIDCHCHTVPAGEATKNWQQLGDLVEWLLDAGAGRDDVLIAFGGGVVGDLTGLAAGLTKRGMRLVQVPTTLLAQVDSSVGGKTAVNTRHGKNLVGMFYQPQLVLADIDLLATLPLRERQAGYAEIVKYGLIDDPAFVNWLEVNGAGVVDLDPEAVTEAVAVSCRAKARIVAQDEREGGVRALLNLGHTFGHTLEAANGYGPALLHGEAVGAGMALALRYSVRLGLMKGQDAERGIRAIAACGLETRLANLTGGPYIASDLAEAMKQDKKARGARVPLILAKGIGQSFIYPDADLSDVSDFLAEELSNR
ncbi:MAG: 3-dehydroquinate synthase [Henriciella sp.]|nr:3-dehydroquinate synthase [Henriciella sp.]